MKKMISFILVLLLLVFSFTSCDSNVKDVISDVDDKTVNILKPTVKFETNGGSKVKSQTTNVVKEEPQTTREDYLFEGWYLDKNLKNAAIFPLTVEYDTTLYAKWLKIRGVAKTESSVTISGKSGYNSGCSFNISPQGFDFDALYERGLNLDISVSYDVYYRKKYDVLWDVGYVGAPRYEVYLLGEDLKGNFKEDIKAPQSTQTKTISMCTSADYFDKNTITLTFSTNNVQNAIYIDNIVVTYTCGK